MFSTFYEWECWSIEKHIGVKWQSLRLNAKPDSRTWALKYHTLLLLFDLQMLNVERTPKILSSILGTKVWGVSGSKNTQLNIDWQMLDIKSPQDRSALKLPVRKRLQGRLERTAKEGPAEELEITLKTLGSQERMLSPGVVRSNLCRQRQRLAPRRRQSWRDGDWPELEERWPAKVTDVYYTPTLCRVWVWL